MDERQQTASERIYDLIPVWDRDDSKTKAQQIDEIYNTISADPVVTINYLLDIIEELNA